MNEQQDKVMFNQYFPFQEGMIPVSLLWIIKNCKANTVDHQNAMEIKIIPQQTGKIIYNHNNQQAHHLATQKQDNNQELVKNGETMPIVFKELVTFHKLQIKLIKKSSIFFLLKIVC